MIGKRINFGMLLILLISIILIALITVFFSKALEERTKEYELMTKNYTDCKNELNHYMNLYKKAEEQLNSTSLDIRKYDQLYETKVQELKDKEAQISEANRKIKTLELLKASLEKQIEDYSKQINDLNQEITDLNSQITSLRKTADYWRDCYDDCEAGTCDC